MLCVDVSPAPNHGSGHLAVKNILKHHGLNAHHIRRARLFQLALFASCALRFGFLIPVSKATFDQIQRTHATTRCVRSIRENASRFGIPTRCYRLPSLRTGFTLAHFASMESKLIQEGLYCSHKHELASFSQ